MAPSASLHKAEKTRLEPISVSVSLKAKLVFSHILGVYQKRLPRSTSVLYMKLLFINSDVMNTHNHFPAIQTRFLLSGRGWAANSEPVELPLPAI